MRRPLLFAPKLYVDTDSVVQRRDHHPMTDVLELSEIPQFEAADYNGNVVSAVARHDEHGKYGPVNVVPVTVGDLTVNLLPEQAIEFAAAVVTNAAFAMGNLAAAQAAINSGMASSVMAYIAVADYAGELGE